MNFRARDTENNWEAALAEEEDEEEEEEGEEEENEELAAWRFLFLLRLPCRLSRGSDSDTHAHKYTHKYTHKTAQI